MRYLMRSILIVLTIFALHSCKSSKDFNYQISEKLHGTKELRQDLEFVQRILVENHPGVYWYITKNDLDRKFDSVKNTIVEPLTSSQFYAKMAPLVAAIRCGHTSIRLPTEILNKEQHAARSTTKYPLEQFQFALSPDRKLFVVSSKIDSSVVEKGAQVLEIDGRAAENIISELLKMISSDGYNKTHQAAALIKAFAQRYQSFYGRKESIELKYMLLNGSVKTVKLHVISKKRIDNNVKPTIAKEKSIKKSPKFRGKYEDGEPQIDFKFLGERKAFAYLKIKSFSIPMANYDQFYKECFDSIKLAGTQNLIIDLRDNGGGSLDASRNLFSYLTDQPFVYLEKPTTNGYFDSRKYGSNYQKVGYLLFGHNDNDHIIQDKHGSFYSFMKGSRELNPHKNNFKGRIFVLINGYTFSAASILSANLKGIKRATFVGEETGGGANQCVAGHLPVLRLKNSKLLLRFGLFKMAPVFKDEDYGHGVYPDIVSSSSIDDRINGIDQELNWIVNQKANK